MTTKGTRNKGQMGRELRPSIFNVRCRTDDGSLLIYNSFTGAIGRVDPDLSDTVEQYLRKGPFTGDAPMEDLVAEGFLVGMSTDEVGSAAAQRGDTLERQDLLHLVILPTEACNFRCVYCYENFKRGRMRSSVRNGVKRFVAARAPMLSQLRVGWFGGEPLVALEVIENLSKHFLRLRDRYGFEYRSGITTNAYLLTPGVAERLFALEVRRFQITLDGAREDHDHRRVLAGGGPTFEVVFRNLIGLSNLDADFHVSVRTNFDRLSAQRIRNLIDLLADKLAGDERFSFYCRPIGQWGGANDPLIPVCVGREAECMTFDLDQYASEKGLGMGYLLDSLSPRGLVCYAAEPHSLAIGSDGTVYKCTVALDDDVRNIVGRLAFDGGLELDRARFDAWIRADARSDPACQRCFIRPVCHGAACPWKRLRDGETPCPPIKKHLKQVLRIVAGSGQKGE